VKPKTDAVCVVFIKAVLVCHLSVNKNDLLSEIMQMLPAFFRVIEHFLLQHIYTK